MNKLTRNSILSVALLICAASLPALAQAPAEPVPPAQKAAPAPTPPVAADAEEDSGSTAQEMVSVGHDTTLAKGEKAIAVVSVFGSSTSEGEVSDAVVSVLGNTRVTGPVGDGAVAVLGDVYVDSRIGGDVVAVLGDVELGPNAEVGGQVVVVGGTLTRAPTAVVRGGVEQVFGSRFQLKGLQPWFEHCVLLGRPLAIAPGLGWAWGVALGFLALYLLLALMFPSSVSRCVRTFETQPGRTLLASLLALLLSPVLIVLLVITVIGMVLVPFLGAGLFVAGIFGKAVMLALIGRQVTKPFGEGPLAHPSFAVLIGGVIVLALYLVPVLGFIIYKLLGILGLGAVLYTLLLASKREPKGPAPASATAAAAGTTYATASAAGTEGASASFTDAQSTAGPAATPPPNDFIADEATLPRAGFWQRMGALFIDVLLIAISVHLLYDVGNELLLLLAAYGAAMWKVKGTTIGGIVFGLRVVRLDGRPIDWATAIVRSLSCFLSLVLLGLGFFWIAFDDERQAWHDKIAGTVVVRVPKGVSLV